MFITMSFVYYHRIKTSETFDISQTRANMNILSNILSFFITIFLLFLLRSPGYSYSKLQSNFRVLKKNCRCSLRSSEQLSLRTPCFLNFWLIFVIPNSRSLNSDHHVFFLMSGDRDEKLVRNVSFPRDDNVFILVLTVKGFKYCIYCSLQYKDHKQKTQIYECIKQCVCKRHRIMYGEFVHSLCLPL